MSHICSRCRCVFYSNAEYKNHNCEAIQQRDQQQVKSTQGMPIEQRLCGAAAGSARQVGPDP